VSIEISRKKEALQIYVQDDYVSHKNNLTNLRKLSKLRNRY